jgi:N-methylhydantoinase A
MRLATDTGGTFTDVLLDRGDGEVVLAKAPTTPDDPIDGVIAAVESAAAAAGLDARALLADTETFIHGTTRALNAIVTGTAARTALLVTEGHPDVLVFREGGRVAPFDFTRPYPAPFVPRRLTFEVPERVRADGAVSRALDEAAARRVIAGLRDRAVEAVAVCLLWSIVNPAHELRLRELLDEELPGVPVSLSHEVNPALREFRRASSTALDASLKPILSDYIARLDERLRGNGFSGQLLITTSDGGMLEASAVARRPILGLNSGPAMAPVAGRHYAMAAASASTAVVADAGGTTYDVSVVRRGAIPRTREAWIGEPILGHMTGFPAIDVRSIGAGGGSVASVDEHGLLHVGPASVGSVPGPACYRRGGSQAAVTDAAVVLGYIDPALFLGGRMRLDAAAAEAAVERNVARPLGTGVLDAAEAVMELATERMANAIGDVTINQGIDPREAVLVAGGGASGLNAVALARRLGFRGIVLPDTGAALSAAGALLSNIVWTVSRTRVLRTDDFDLDAANQTIAELRDECAHWSSGSARDARVSLSVEARYDHQAWEIELELPVDRFGSIDDVERFVDAFHAHHRDLFGIHDPGSAIEVVTWRARAEVAATGAIGAVRTEADAVSIASREVTYQGAGTHTAEVRHAAQLQSGDVVRGPAILELPAATLVLDPGAAATRRADGSFFVSPLVDSYDAGAAGAQGARR